jgi:hypothetical protein
MGKQTNKQTNTIFIANKGISDSYLFVVHLMTLLLAQDIERWND